MRMYASTLGVLLAFGAGAGTAAPSSRGLFPQEVVSAGADSSFPDRMEAHRLWVQGASRGYRQRLRMFLGGHTVKSWSISIDELSNGRGMARWTEHDGSRVVETGIFRVGTAQLRELDALIQKAGLWTIYPQFFIASDEESICIDGMTLILERVNAAGYRYAEANAQCTAGAAQLAVAAKMLDAAKRSDLRRLLR